jgi:hypothetical protein
MHPCMQVDSMLHNTPFPVLAVVGAPRGPHGATAPTALVSDPFAF